MKALLIAPSETPLLDPLARVTPAALLPLFGEPLIAPLLRRLSQSGVTDVVLACPSRSGAYKRALREGRSWGLNLAYLEVADVGSTSLVLDAVRARGFHDQTLAVLPANCWTDADWAALEARHWEAGGGLSGVNAGRSSTGAMLVDPKVSLSAAPWRAISGDFRWRCVASWPEYWTLAEEALENPQLGVAPSFEHTGRELRLGPLASIDTAGVDAEGPVWLGAGARVEAGVTLRGPTWIGSDCHVGPGVTLESCIVETASRLHGPLVLQNVLVTGNRAIDFRTGDVRFLDELPGEHNSPEADSAMTLGLLRLATRTARRGAAVLRAAR
jgi:NDP-sugar pyrophosphorylase family protein